LTIITRSYDYAAIIQTVPKETLFTVILPIIDDFARNNIAPEDGIEKSSFFEAINSRGLEQLEFVFKKLSCKASNILPNQHPELGELVAFDGSLSDAVLSMAWADYRKGSPKAKVHIGFDLNRGIPRKIFLTDGNGAERPFVNKILSPGQTGGR